ncbi:MAG TPA: hypothetical protein VGX78_05910 [Pirellulales bacterium]|nr:hypothetical protein [Pirellulales bacterium]
MAITARGLFNPRPVQRNATDRPSGPQSGGWFGKALWPIALASRAAGSAILPAMMSAAPTKAKPKRRRLQFRLRNLFVFVAILAVACGWFKWRLVLRERQRAAVAAIHASGGVFSTPLRLPPPPKWKIQLLGLRHYFPLTGVSFTPVSATDADMRNIAAIGTLESVCLDGSDVTDAGLAELKVLTNLTVLDLSGTNVTDDGIADFRRALPNCKTIR